MCSIFLLISQADSERFFEKFVFVSFYPHAFLLFLFGIRRMMSSDIRCRMDVCFQDVLYDVIGQWNNSHPTYFLKMKNYSPLRTIGFYSSFLICLFHLGQLHLVFRHFIFFMNQVLRLRAVVDISKQTEEVVAEKSYIPSDLSSCFLLILLWIKVNVIT